MVSRNRNTSHMFAFYAGQHQSIKGFHTLFQSNTPHTAATIRRMTELGLPNTMSCVLTGPFTSAQKAQVLKRTTVSRSRMMAAFTFLKENNVRYSDLHINQVDYEFPEPLVMDESEEEEGSDDPREHIFETTVFFPDGSEVRRSTGGHSSGTRFTMEYFQRNLQGSSSSALMTSRPTTEYASDLTKEFLVDSFPLQFPYGIGGPKDKRETKVEYLDMLQYYLRVADCNFMRHDFVLLVHSLWEKEKAMTTAMIRCQVKLSNGESVAQNVGNLSVEALEAEMQIRVNGARRESHANSSAKMLLDGIDTSCKAMAHTNQASKSARRRMFSMWYSICSPGIFFTVSPCDETNFRLRLYIGRAEVSEEIDNLLMLSKPLWRHNYSPHAMLCLFPVHCSRC
jgi:hypothetical protein